MSRDDWGVWIVECHGMYWGVWIVECHGMIGVFGSLSVT